MPDEKDYTKDIFEIRSMMERSSRFWSLSGLAGILAGIYALAGAYIVHAYFGFQPSGISYDTTDASPAALKGAIFLAILLLILSVGTAIYLSYKRAGKRSEPVWNPTSRRMLINMSLPLASGGILILIFLSQGLIGLLIPMTLIFYGLSLFSAGHFTFREIRFLGMIQIALGLLSILYIEYSLLLWAIGFGIMHIACGIYIHFRHER